MKKLYTVLVMAIMAIAFSFNAKADFTVTLKVDDATRLTANYQYYGENWSMQQVDLDLTQFTGEGGSFTVPASSCTLNVYATEGNTITSFVNEVNGSSASTPTTKISQYLYQDATFSVTSADIESTRTASCTVNIDDASKVNVSYYTGTSIALQNGENTVKFNPNGEVPFQISNVNYGETLYSVTLNGVEQSNSYGRYYVTPADGDVLDIKANYPDEPSVITFTYGENEEKLLGCVSVKVDGNEVSDFDGKTLTAKLGQKITIVGNTNLYNFNYAITVDGASTYFYGNHEFTANKTSHTIDLSHVTKYEIYTAYVTVNDVTKISGVYVGNSSTALTLNSGEKTAFELTSNSAMINIIPAENCYIESIKVNGNEYGSNYGSSSVTVRNINENDEIDVTVNELKFDNEFTLWVDDMSAASQYSYVMNYSTYNRYTPVTGENVYTFSDGTSFYIMIQKANYDYAEMYLNDIKISNSQFYPANGDYVKAYVASSPAAGAVTFTQNVENIIAGVTINDNEYTNWASGFTVLAGTKVAFTLNESEVELTVTANDVELTADAEGKYVVEISEDTNIVVSEKILNFDVNVTVDNVEQISIYPGAAETPAEITSGVATAINLLVEQNYINVVPANTDCYIASIQVNGVEYAENYGYSSYTVRDLAANDNIVITSGKIDRDQVATIWVDDLTAAAYGYSVQRYSDRVSVELVSGEAVTVNFTDTDNPYYVAFFQPTYCNLFMNGIYMAPQYEGSTSNYVTFVNGDALKIYLASEPAKYAVTFTQNVENAIATVTTDGQATESWADGFTALTGTIVAFSLNEGSEVTVNVGEEEIAANEEGLYIVEITKDTEIEINAPKSGIEEINAGVANGNVYNTQGILLIKNATNSEIENLPAGFYIINGKKVIRK